MKPGSESQAGLPIVTSRLEIRDFVVDDFPAVHRYASDPEVTRFLSWGPNSEEETRAFLRRAQSHISEKPRRQFELGVLERESRELIGGCGLHGRRETFREYEIGYCLRRDRWSRGIASEAVRALSDFGFGGINAHRIYAQVFPDNTASSRLLERLGFRREGHLRRDAFVRGKWYDTLVYAMLEEEWQGSR